MTCFLSGRTRSALIGRRSYVPIFVYRYNRLEKNESMSYHRQTHFANADLLARAYIARMAVEHVQKVVADGQRYRFQL